MEPTQSKTASFSFASGVLSPDELQRKHRLHAMRIRATGLLIAVGILFLFTFFLPKDTWGLSYFRAFAEAALVGGMADWFAVTALFYHPLGLPIPHTAIIPSKKENIGKSMGRFVESNFLASDLISGRITSLNLSQRLAGWLEKPENRHSMAERLTQILPQALNTLDDAAISHSLADVLQAQLAKLELSPIVGELLDFVTATGKHQVLLDEALEMVSKLFQENKPVIRQKMREGSPWFVPRFVDDQVSDKIVLKVSETLKEINQNATHPLRQRFDSIVSDFITRLKTSPEYHEYAEQMKTELLSHPSTVEALQDIWPGLRRSLITSAEGPESSLTIRIEKVLDAITEKLSLDAELREKLNATATQAVVYLVESQRAAVAQGIAQTVAAWDGRTLTEKLELQVGRDLQFIRINGTLVGGLVGLILHFLQSLLT